jgi:hypothetical protein
MKFYYGVPSVADLQVICEKVVYVLGGGELAVKLLMETCAAETLCGLYPDNTPARLGVGVPQIDEIALIDIKQEGEKRHFDLIKKHFNYDIKNTKLQYLAFDPLLSIIVARLVYKRKPQAIPKTLCERADYWKELYNTSAGKGDQLHYLDNVAKVLGEDWR